MIAGRADVGVRASDAADASSHATLRARVLLADDHQLMLDRLSALLAGEFSVVGTVLDGYALVHAAGALRPDVLVVDISMPRMNGLEAAARIRRTGSTVPVVCLTAHEEPEFLAAAVGAGALGYVTKASVAHDLVPAIRAALAGQQFISESMKTAD